MRASADVTFCRWTMKAAQFISPLVVVLSFSGCTVLDQSDAPLGYRKTGQIYTGKMSWYSVRTNGGTRTASGEPFSDGGVTAAHRSLPFGTKVEVTNLNNGKSETVRITDRGPFIAGRIIDVSIETARKLDFVGNGIAPCRVEVLAPVGRAR